MLKSFAIRSGFMLLPISLFISCSKTEPVAHPYASPVPLSVPVIFDANNISTEAPEFATSFSPDGKTAFFNLATADRETLRIVQSRFTENSWSKPIPLHFSDGTYRDVDPCISPDGSRLYFSSNRPIDGDNPKADFDTWFAEWKGNQWGEPVNPGAPLNGPDHEIFVSISGSGILYFSSNRDQSSGMKIFRSQSANGAFQEPVYVDLGVAPEANVGNPVISPSSDFLIFSSSDLGGYGGSDLFISHLEGERWTKPMNLGDRINSPQSDFAPCISPDGQYLFFTSERPGIVGKDQVQGRPPGDIYQVDLPTRQDLNRQGSVTN